MHDAIKKRIEEFDAYYEKRIRGLVENFMQGKTWRRQCMPITSAAHDLIMDLVTESFIKRMKDTNKKGVKKLRLDKDKWFTIWTRDFGIIKSTIREIVDMHLISDGTKTGWYCLHNRLKKDMIKHKDMVACDSKLVIMNVVFKVVSEFMTGSKDSHYFVRAERTTCGDGDIQQPEFGF